MKDVVYYGEYAARTKDDIMLSFAMGIIAIGTVFCLGILVGVNL